MKRKKGGCYSLIDRNRKTAWWMATGIGVTLLAEMALLLTQAVRGQLNR